MSWNMRLSTTWCCRACAEICITLLTHSQWLAETARVFLRLCMHMMSSCWGPHDVRAKSLRVHLAHLRHWQQHHREHITWQHSKSPWSISRHTMLADIRHNYEASPCWSIDG
jgi:hypothetical protein